MTQRVNAAWTVTIEQPPEVVFDYLADVAKHSEWSPRPLRIERAAGPVASGDTFASIGTMPGDKNHRNDVTVTECSRPSRLVLDATEKGEHFLNTFELQGQGAATLLTRRLDAPKPGGLMGLAFPVIMAAFIRPDVQKGLRMLKANLERL